MLPNTTQAYRRVKTRRPTSATPSASAIARSAWASDVRVRAGEEVQLALDGGELGAAAASSALGERLGLGGQRDSALQVAALEHDRGLEHERAAAQRGVVERARDLVAADRLRQRSVVVLVVEVPGAIKRPVDLDRIAGGHQISVRRRARGT